MNYEFFSFTLGFHLSLSLPPSPSYYIWKRFQHSGPYCVRNLLGECGNMNKSCCVSRKGNVRHGDMHSEGDLCLRSKGGKNVQAYFDQFIPSPLYFGYCPIHPQDGGSSIHQTVGE